jgi:hypothetical protein
LARGTSGSGTGVLDGISGTRGSVTAVVGGCVVDVLVVETVVDGCNTTMLVTVETELEQEDRKNATNDNFINNSLIALPPSFDTRLLRMVRTPAQLPQT